MPGNKFCIPLSKSLSPVSSATFRHLPSTLHYCEALWFLRVLWERKQTVVAKSEITVLRSVVKQLPVDIMHQCSRTSSYMETRTVMKDNYTACQHSKQLVLNYRMYFSNVSQCTSDVIVVSYCMSPDIITPFLSQRISVISFLAGN
jgi:hypothetical protein